MIRLVGRFPMSLEFDHDPADEELVVVLGPNFTVARVPWHEDDERIVVNGWRAPVRTAIAAIVLLFGGLAVAAIVVTALRGGAVHVDPWFTIGLALFVLLAVVPGVTFLLLWIDKAMKQLGPGAVVTKRTGELQLPWIHRTVARRDIVRFVDLRGRHRYRSGLVTFAGQFGVLFVADGGRFVYAPVARATAPPLGKSCAQRLADFYDLPVQRVDAGMI